MAVATEGPSHYVGPFPFREPMPSVATAISIKHKQIQTQLITKTPCRQKGARRIHNIL